MSCRRRTPQSPVAHHVTNATEAGLGEKRVLTRRSRLAEVGGSKGQILGAQRNDGFRPAIVGAARVNFGVEGGEDDLGAARRGVKALTDAATQWVSPPTSWGRPGVVSPTISS